MNRWSRLGKGWLFLICALLLGGVAGDAVKAQETQDVCTPADGAFVLCRGQIDTFQGFYLLLPNGQPLRLDDLPPGHPLEGLLDTVMDALKKQGIDPDEIFPILWSIGREGGIVNEGTLESKGIRHVGFSLLGEDVWLLNQEGAVIDAQTAEDALDKPAIGVFVGITRGSDGKDPDGQPVWHLENHGHIEARGGSGRPLKALSGEIAYTSGALLVGHNVNALNTGTIRGAQLGDGEGEKDRFIGVVSYWALLGSATPFAPAPNLMVNQGEGALIEGEGFQATGVLLVSDPTWGPLGEEGYQHRLFNQGGTIRALGKQEAVGVDVVGGLSRIDNQGSIESETQQPGGVAIGVRAAGSTLYVVNGAPGGAHEAEEGLAALAADLTGAGKITATAHGGTAIGVFIHHPPGSDERAAVVNGKESVIEASGQYAKGALLTGKDIDFSHAGSVEASGDAWAVGVASFAQETTLSNTGDIFAAGAGTSIGVWLGGKDSTFESEADGTVRAEGQKALGLRLSGDHNEVMNQGTIQAISQDKNGAVGIDMAGRSAVVENAGRIEAQGNGAVGVRIGGKDNRLVNHKDGVIQATGESAVGVVVNWHGETDALPLENHGTIMGAETGVLVFVQGKHDGRVVNRGRISGGGEHTGIHIVFDDAGDDTKVTVENKPGGVITGADGVAIRATDVTPDGDGDGTVWLVNEGTIRGDVNLQTGGNHTVISKGAHVLTPSLIDGNLFLGSGNDTVSIELGKVKGNMSLGAGDDELTVAGSVVEGNMDLGAGGDWAAIKGSTVTGDLRLGSGKDQLTVDTKVRIFGAIDGGRSETGQLEEDLLVLLDGDGTGQLLGVQNFHTIDNSAGGDWEFGQLSVDQGQQVNVIGSLTAGLVWLAPDARLVIDHLVVDHVSIYGEVNQAGFLAGSGTLQGILSMEGGHISPGEKEGDMASLYIEGNYVQGAKATYIVDLVPQQEGEKFGQSDRIVISGGKALFEEGTTIQVRAARGAYGSKSEYQIVDGELHDDMLEEGRLESIRVITDSPFLKGSLKMGSLVLILEKDFTAPAQTPNQKGVAEAISKAPPGAMDRIQEALMSLKDDEAARDAFDQLSGEIYTTYLGVGESSMSQFMRLVTRGVDLPVPVKDNKIWADVYTHFNRIDGTRENAHWELQQTGVVFGFGRDTSEQTRFGLFGGVNRSHVDMPARRSSSTGDGFQVGAYGRYRGEKGSILGIVAFGQGRHHVERNIRFGGYRTTAKGLVDERALGLSVEGRLHYDISGFQVEPLLGLTWMDLNQSRLTESSGDEARLRISETGANVFRGTLGVRVGTMPNGVGVWPEFLLAWVNDFHDLPREVEAEFLASPGNPFTVQGTKVGRSAIVAGVSIEGVRDNGMTWQLGYRGEFRDNRSVHTGMLSFHFPL